MCDRFVALTRELGLHAKGQGLHKLRHAFGTYSIHLGVSQSAVRDWMGHADERTARG
jgi:integrase